jgi:hypothetical protein
LKRLLKAPSLVLAALLVFLLPLSPAFSQEGGEETYSISLVQTAESDKEIHELEGRKVLAETYTVQKGDHLWQLLRERGLLEKSETPRVARRTQEAEHVTFPNLDLIHPGEKIVIPLILSPVKGLAGTLAKATTCKTPLSCRTQEPQAGKLHGSAGRFPDQGRQGTLRPPGPTHHSGIPGADPEAEPGNSRSQPCLSRSGGAAAGTHAPACSSAHPGSQEKNALKQKIPTAESPAADKGHHGPELYNFKRSSPSSVKSG